MQRDCRGRDARRAGERECRGGAGVLGESTRNGGAQEQGAVRDGERQDQRDETGGGLGATADARRHHAAEQRADPPEREDRCGGRRGGEVFGGRGDADLGRSEHDSRPEVKRDQHADRG
jgi:hypothetical protein